MTLSQLADDLALAHAESRLSFLLENVGDIDARALLDFRVAVDEIELEVSGELFTDR